MTGEKGWRVVVEVETKEKAKELHGVLEAMQYNPEIYETTEILFDDEENE